jgi:protein-disulfide isomerase
LVPRDENAGEGGVLMPKCLQRPLAIAAAMLLALGIARAEEARPPIWQMVEKTPSGPLPGEPVLGKADAPLTIIEYASLTCPHCAAFDTQTLPKIRRDWIDTGKARLVFRDFPLDGLALRAAVLTHCVPGDRYFGFIDALFREQRDWVDLAEPYARIASLGGLTQTGADACLADRKRSEAVAATRAAAENEYGVDSTPTFFIDGMKIVGAYPYENPEEKNQNFKSALELAYARRIKDSPPRQ